MAARPPAAASRHLGLRRALVSYGWSNVLPASGPARGSRPILARSGMAWLSPMTAGVTRPRRAAARTPGR